MKIAHLAALITLLVPSAALAQQFQSSAGPLRVDTVASGLAHPWGLQFLPDGRMLVTERPGRMRIVSRDGKLSPPVRGVPQVFARGQGGLLDVALDRNFAQNRTIYFSFAEPYQGGARTALARAVLDAGEQPCAHRYQAHLPAARPALAVQPLRRPHRAGARRQSVPLHRRPLHRPRQGADARQPASARSFASRPTAARRATIRSSAATTRCRKSGPMACATRKAWRCIRRPARCG